MCVWSREDGQALGLRLGGWKNNDTLWHAFVININELRNEPRRIRRTRNTHAHTLGHSARRQEAVLTVRHQVSGQDREHYTNDTTLDKPKCKLAYKPGFVFEFWRLSALAGLSWRLCLFCMPHAAS